MEAMFHVIEENNRELSTIFLVLLLIWESTHPFFLFFVSKTKSRIYHGMRNLILGMINAMIVSLLFVRLWLWAAETAEEKEIGLLYWLHTPDILHAILVILFFDFWTYWWHRMNHEIPFFWNFHCVHHSDNKMDVTTANRFHLGEIFFSSLFRIPLILLFGAKIWHLALYEMIMFPVVQFHHANIGVKESFDKLLRIGIVTPAMHKVHHSRVKQETNSNYTSFLSLWDRLFGTFRLREKPTNIHLGLDEMDNDNYQNMVGLIKTPWYVFKKSKGLDKSN